MSTSTIYVGMDVHKDSVMVAVFEGLASEPERVERLPNDVPRLRRFFERLSKRGEIRSCYEASGAGYVLHREITNWGHHCDVVATSWTPAQARSARRDPARSALSGRGVSHDSDPLAGGGASPRPGALPLASSSASSGL